MRSADIPPAKEHADAICRMLIVRGYEVRQG
jgi:hypothetical protein